MKRLLLVIGFLSAMGVDAWAGTWCDNFDGVIAPLAIFCDCFDKYCPEPDNNPCAQDQQYNPWISHAWPRNSWSYHNSQNEVCGNEIIFGNVQSQLTTSYHGATIMNGGDEGGVLGQSTRTMVDGIHAKFGSAYDRVLGTDMDPLVLEFDMASGIQSAAGLNISNGFVELALEEQTLTKQEFLALGYDPEVSPTDYIKVGGDDEKLAGCKSCWGMCKGLGATDGRAPHHAWPTICQSYDARTEFSLCPNPADPNGPPIPCGPPYCPETPITKLHKTIAIGALAMLDPNPCHCENPVKPDNSRCGPNNVCNTVTGFCSATGGSARPCTTDADCPKEMPEYTNHTMTNNHLSFFDGWKWRILSSKIFDPVQGIPGVIGNGDFILGDKIDHVKITIKTSTVRIEHGNAQNKGQWIPYAGDPLCEPDAQRNDTIAGGITITDSGSGYTTAPTVMITPPSSGRQATAIASINNGAVDSIMITDPGKGYSSPPAITISPPSSGTQAKATATLGGAAHYEPGLASWADNIPRKYFGPFNVIRLGNPSSCRLCSADLASAGGDYANCAPDKWDGTSYQCTEFNQKGGAGATWCKRMSGINGCYGSNIDDGSNFVTVDSLVVTGGSADASVGACCKPDGSCALTTIYECAAQGGVFRGPNTPCQGSTCLGACCHAFGACTEGTLPTTCNGRFQGPGTTCAQPCPCPTPWADADQDEDVDMLDFGIWQQCFTGMTIGVATNCECYDRDNNDKIDADDFTAFEKCFTGPTIRLNPASPPTGCTP